MNTLSHSRVLEIIRNISDFEIDSAKPFVIVGPAGNGDRKLRIYCNGGDAGRIGYPGSSNCRLLDPGYRRYISLSEEKLFDDFMVPGTTKMISGAECNNIIDTPEYLKIAYHATRNKHLKRDGEVRERDIQTRIVKQFMNRSDFDWYVTDMETSITKDMVPNSLFIKNVKKPDIIVFDKVRNEFGLIELKYNNDSTENILEHYNVSLDILYDPQATITELCRRAQIMSSFGLIDDYISRNTDAIISTNRIWFGFLFVGGGKNVSAEISKRHLIKLGTKVSDACRFLYVDSIDELNISGLAYDKMFSYHDFIK